MSQPSSTPTWATDTNISTGTEAGTPTKVDPGAAYKAQGFVPGLNFIGPYANYILNSLCAWVAYLKALDTDAYFLGQVYTWTAAHVFKATATIWSGLTVLDASGAHPATVTSSTGFSTSDTNSATNGVQINNASGDFKFASARNRTKHIELKGNGDWADHTLSSNTDESYIQTGTNAGLTRQRLRLPQGAGLDGFIIRHVNPANSISAAGSARLISVDDSGTVTSLGSVTFNTTVNSTETKTLSGAGATVDNTNTRYYVEITASNGASGSVEAVHWVKEVFADYGPRND